MIKTTKKTPPSVPTIIATKLTGNRKIEVESVNEKKERKENGKKETRIFRGIFNLLINGYEEQKERKNVNFNEKKKRRKVNLKVF